MQVTYVQLLSNGENTITSVCQWELASHYIFSNRRWTTCSKVFKYLCIYRHPFGYGKNDYTDHV